MVIIIDYGLGNLGSIYNMLRWLGCRDMEITSDKSVQNPDFWLNHVGNSDGSGEYTTYSGYGNRAKIEFISRSDLLRARGYGV